MHLQKSSGMKGVLSHDSATLSAYWGYTEELWTNEMNFGNNNATGAGLIAQAIDCSEVI